MPKGTAVAKHDDGVAWCVQVAAQVSRAEVGACLAVGLAERCPRYQAAFFAHVLGERVAPHPHFPLQGPHVPDADRDYCDTCIGLVRQELDFKDLEERRQAFFGEFYGPIEYAFVLQRQIAEGFPDPTDRAKAIVRALFDAIASIDEGGPTSALEKRLGTVFRSNKYERRKVVEMLFMARILVGTASPSSTNPRTEWSDEALAWRGRDAYSRASARSYFPWLVDS